MRVRIDAIKINMCGQLNRPDMSLLSLYYHVSGQSSSANETARYFILMNIHKNGHMIHEWIRRITHVVESLAKFYKSELVMKRWNVKYAKKSAWFINVAVLQRPNFNKKHHSDELLTLPNLVDLWSRSDEVNMWPFWEKKADRKNKISIGSFLTKYSNNIWNVI